MRSARRAVRAATAMAAALAVLGALLGGCGGGPRPADWEVEAKAATEDATAAYLVGNEALEASRAAQARAAVARSGRIDLLARVALTRCAARVASLVFEPCGDFEALRADAPAAERAYADYLAGRLAPPQIALLPPSQRAAAATGTGAGDAAAGALRAIVDPFARLVAAGVLLQSGHADPAAITLAIDTASAQGWRRPLLAWLGVQALRADKAGDVQEAERLRRRAQQVVEAR